MENDLYLEPKKCEFCKEKIEWLGMVIEEGKITMDPGKLKGIQDWPAPTMVKQVRGFLGFGNFYRRFIRGFSEIARPLNELLKKDKKFEWTAECQRAFEDLKIRFTSCYNFSYFALFTYDFSLFLEVSHGAAALTHFSLTHIAATLLTHCTAVVLTHSIAVLIALPHWCSIYSGQSCRLFLS